MNLFQRIDTFEQKRKEWIHSQILDDTSSTSTVKCWLQNVSCLSTQFNFLSSILSDLLMVIFTKQITVRKQSSVWPCFWLIDRIQIVFDENQWYLFQYLEVSHDISQKLSDSIWWLLRYDCACGRNVDYRIVKSGDIIGLWTIRNEKYLFQL